MAAVYVNRLFRLFVLVTIKSNVSDKRYIGPVIFVIYEFEIRYITDVFNILDDDQGVVQ